MTNTLLIASQFLAMSNFVQTISGPTVTNTATNAQVSGTIQLEALFGKAARVSWQAPTGTVFLQSATNIPGTWQDTAIYAGGTNRVVPMRKSMEVFRLSTIPAPPVPPEMPLLPKLNQPTTRRLQSPKG